MTSSYFGSAHHFVSNIDTVITATNYHQHGGGVSDWWLQQLREHVSDGSMHNSADRFNAPTCHPDTRKAVQEDIFSWMTHDDRDGEPKKILWMSGPAGCGKTAIAGSVAETCQERGILAASFFFSSFSPSLSRRRKRFLIPT
ncbi:hypothetical protein NMY22_g12335 [Coprinellus aureogranulatus]|nr:hypothetical protein NMY22_g12335 [Coprinellus aureogranulatus]